MGQATWDTGWFQAQVYRLLLQELGYSVEAPYTLENPAFYVIAAQGDIDFWVNGWFPLHDYYLSFDKVLGNVSVLGNQVESGALQGYLVDKRTADMYNITGLADLLKPEIASLFDTNGDGLAELIGCNVGWGCAQVINHHMDVFELSDTVQHVQGNYSALMQETVERYRNGEPVLFYTWTPNWTLAELALGEDVVWISVPYSSLPRVDYPNTVDANVAHCRPYPCNLGFGLNSIQVVASNEFLEANPGAKMLFELVFIPLEDISQQNILMFQGEYRQEDIERHAASWIEENRELVDTWLSQARAASQDGN